MPRTLMMILSPTRKKLGIEGNLHINYELVENLNLQLIGAYLWADDATSTDGNNKEDPYEIGFETSLSF